MHALSHYDRDLVSLQLGQVPGDLPPGMSGDPGGTVCAPGEALDMKTGACVSGGLPAGFVRPGEVPVRPGNWELDHKPHALYTLAPGDTYTGLAATYLGNGSRWRELWDLNRGLHPSPDVIYAGQRINMTDEAKNDLKKKTGQDGLFGIPYTYLVGGAAVGVALLWMSRRRSS